MTNLTRNSFFLYVYFNPLHVSSNLVLIIAAVKCINTTSGICHCSGGRLVCRSGRPAYQFQSPSMWMSCVVYDVPWRRFWNVLPLTVHAAPALFIYLLAPWSRVLLEKLTGLQLVKKFPAFYGTRRFITALPSARHLSRS
jgi:hypothetical protein